MPAFGIRGDLAAARVYHRPPSIPTTAYNGPDGTLSTLTTVANTMYLTPMEIDNSKWIDRLVIECTTLAASSSVRVGVYTTDRSGFPARLVDSSDLGTAADTTATGVKSVTENFLCPEGRIWLAAVAQGGTPVLRSHTDLTDVAPAARTDAVINARRVGYSYAGVSGALPSVLVTATLAIASNVPAFLLRAL